MRQPNFSSAIELFVQRALIDDLLASLFSTAALAWRGRVETGSAAAPINAPSHWRYGREALRRNALTWRYTGTGAATHAVCGLLWAGLYRSLRGRRGQRSQGAVGAIGDAVAVTAVAAAVDLRLAPERARPGFERRLSAGSLVLVYAAFAAGLALGGLRTER